MANQDYRGGGLTRRGPGLPAWTSGSGFGGMDPWREMTEMRRRMDDLFAGVLGGGLMGPTPWWLAEQGDQAEPDVDIYEKDDEYVVHAALPGVKPEDIHLDATDDTIRLSAEYRSPMEEQGGQPGQQAGNQGVKQHRQSRYSRQGSFFFSYSFPQEIRTDDVRADLNNGRLELHLPKVQTQSSASRPRQIPVTAGGAQSSSTRQMTGTSEAGQPQKASSGEQVAGRAGRTVNLSREPTLPAQAGQNQPAAIKDKTPRKKAA